MEAHKISVQLLRHRLNADYYTREALDNEDRVRRFGCVALGTKFDPVDSGYGVLPGSEEYLPIGTGVGLVRGGDLQSGAINPPGVYAPLSYRTDWTALQRGDVLLLIKGACIDSPEGVGLVGDTEAGHIFNGSCYRIRTSGYDGGFLVAYCLTDFFLIQKRREIANTGISYNDENSIHDYLVPDSSPKVQNYIGNKVRCAELLRTGARTLEAKVSAKFAFLTSNLLTSKKAWWATQTDLEPYRINAPHYDAVVLDMLQKARAATGLVSLQSLFGARDITGGATPLGAEYPPNGVFFVRVQNVKPYRLDLSDAVYIDAATDEELKRSRCVEGDVILSITGYPGTASFVMADDLPVNINQHSVRLNIVGDLTSEFVTAALNSPFLKRQVDRLAIGGTREALDYASVGNLQIPVLPKPDRDEITAWVSMSNRCVRAASRLTAASKFLVEALIEGKVTEVELVAAQEPLERGDDAADRALLRRLSRHGLDIPAQPPLFPDLDALYALLAQTREANA